MDAIKILDIGCGKNKTAGAIGMDRVASVSPDVLHDLDVYPYPFPDSEFDRVVILQAVEHISDVLKFMEEVHRISKPGCTVEIVTPHFSSSNSWTDPTHKQHLGYYSFDFFCEGEGRVDFYTDCRYEMVEKRVDFFNRYKWIGIEFFANRFPRSWEKYCCYIFPAKNLYFTLKVLKP